MSTTPLSRACESGGLETVKFLLELGANPLQDLRTEKYDWPCLIDIICMSEHPDTLQILELLLPYGISDPEHTTINPLFMTTGSGRPDMAEAIYKYQNTDDVVHRALINVVSSAGDPNFDAIDFLIKRIQKIEIIEKVCFEKGKERPGSALTVAIYRRKTEAFSRILKKIDFLSYDHLWAIRKEIKNLVCNPVIHEEFEKILLEEGVLDWYKSVVRFEKDGKFVYFF